MEEMDGQDESKRAARLSRAWISAAIGAFIAAVAAGLALLVSSLVGHVLAFLVAGLAIAAALAFLVAGFFYSRKAHIDAGTDACEESGETEPAEGDEKLISEIEDLKNEFLRNIPGTELYESVQSSKVDLPGMILHSSDLFTTLKDLGQQSGLFGKAGMVACLLARFDISQWEDPPKISAVRLSRTKRYWLGDPKDSSNLGEYDLIEGCEAILNICDDVCEGLDDIPQDFEGISALVKGRLDGISSLDLDAESFKGRRDEAMEALGAIGDADDLSARLHMADLVEGACTPFRMMFDMRFDLAGRTVLSTVEIPRPDCFSFLAGSDRKARCLLAREYAIRSLFFVARCALDSASVDTAVVTGCEHGSSIPVLSLKVCRGSFEHVNALMSSGDFDHLCESDNLRIQYDETLWLLPVEPHVRISSGPPFASKYDAVLEVDGSECSSRVRDACRADLVSDLGSSAKLVRHAAWESMSGHIGKSVLDSISALNKAKDDYPQADVAEACNRLSKALVEGSVSPDDSKAQEQLFLNSGTLGAALLFARAFAASPTQERVQKSIDNLSDAVAPWMQINYLDDTETIYRYFNDTAERILFNINEGDSSRKVVLVSEEYFLSIRELVRLHAALGNLDASLAYADEMMRIAPVSTDSHMARANILAQQGRIFDAFEQAKECVSLAVKADPAAYCYYRLAYFAWRLGKNELAVACFLRSLSYKTSVSFLAFRDLAELIKEEPELAKMSQDEVDRVIKDNGIPLMMEKFMREQMMRAAAVCAEDSLYPAAAQLMGVYSSVEKDDALLDVCRSYRTTSEFGKR